MNRCAPGRSPTLALRLRTFRFGVCDANFRLHAMSQMLKSSGSMAEFLRSLRNQAWLLSLLLVAATLLAYQPAWSGKPIWDDDQHMTPSRLRSMTGLSRIWMQPGATQQYYPLTYSAFWMENKLWGNSTLGYHLVNILLHAASALLVVRILQKLEVPGAWLAAGIFALHPVQVESVAWISELKNTLSGVFYLGSALAYLKFDRTRNRKLFAAALGLFILGLLSKTVIATLPAAWLLIFWWKRGRLFWKQDVLPLAPFFLTGIGTGLFTAWFEQKVLHAEGQAYDFSFIERILIAGRAGDEAIGLDGAKNRSGLRIDLMDFPVSILPDPKRPFGPGESRAAAAGRRDGGEHAPGLRIDFLDSLVRELKQVPAVESRSRVRGDIDRAQRFPALGIEGVELVSRRKPHAFTVKRHTIHTVDARKRSILTEDFGWSCFHAPILIAR